jgi:hypothetical protein
MNIESRFGANKRGQQPSEMSYLVNRENALLAHTLDRQILEEIAHKTSENFDISTRFWSKSRSHRKQMTKPFLPGATTTTRQAPPRAQFASHLPQCQELLNARQLGALRLLNSRRKISPTSRSREKHVWYTWNLGQQ